MLAARKKMRTVDPPSDAALNTLLNQMKSPPGIAVPLKFEIIELTPGLDPCSIAFILPRCSVAKVARRSNAF
jgi:hypothetical protein